MFNQEDLSIFGATGEGVPNPRVGHIHPYPTRHHGPIWTQPQAGYPYRSSTYVRPSFNGMGAPVLPIDLTPEQIAAEAQRRGMVMALAGLAAAAVLAWGMGAFGKNPKSMLPQWMAKNARRRRHRRAR